MQLLQERVTHAQLPAAQVDNSTVMLLNRMSVLPDCQSVYRPEAPVPVHMTAGSKLVGTKNRPQLSSQAGI